MRIAVAALITLVVVMLLPLVAYGGTSMLTMMVGLRLVLNALLKQ